jgi:hypothetical protein
MIATKSATSFPRTNFVPNFDRKKSKLRQTIEATGKVLKTIFYAESRTLSTTKKTKTLFSEKIVNFNSSQFSRLGLV